MIPLKDENRSSGIPVITFTIIFVNAVVFIYQYFLGQLGFEKYVYGYGLTPYNLLHPVSFSFSFHSPIPEYFKIVSSMFMHGGFPHIIANMWFLWIFGDNVENAMGKIKFPIFYLLCGIIATLTHSIFNPISRIPLVGASGAIAGVMGAYFILYPKAKILTLFWFFIFVRIISIPAFFYIAFWFVIQLMFSSAGGPVAYLAHVGGFIAGIVLVFFFTKRQKGFRIIRIR